MSSRFFRAVQPAEMSEKQEVAGVSCQEDIPRKRRVSRVSGIGQKKNKSSGSDRKGRGEKLLKENLHKKKKEVYITDHIIEQKLRLKKGSYKERLMV